MENASYFLCNSSAWWGLLSWPQFSLTSFRIVSSLKRQGVSPRTVLDVGANVGQFAIACAKIFRDVTVHSFEPEPGSLDKLRQNAARVGRVQVYPVALGEKPGEVNFRVNSHSHSSSVLALGERHRRAFPYAQELSTIRVPVSTLDYEMGSVSLERPVFLKLDVQGYEPQVLEGAVETLKRVDHVLLEASFRPMYEGEKTFMDIARTMESYGFQFLRPVDWLSDPHNGEVLQMDALFARAAGRS